MPLRIYLDENVDPAIAQGLRRRGVEAWTTSEAGNIGASDEEQLSYAAEERAVIFTHDDDLVSLAHKWRKQGKTHWGVIYVHQRKYGIGECIRRLKVLADLFEPEDFVNHIEFL